MLITLSSCPFLVILNYVIVCCNNEYDLFLIANDVFRALNTKYKSEGLAVSCSFFEIYSGKVQYCTYLNLLSGNYVKSKHMVLKYSLSAGVRFAEQEATTPRTRGRTQRCAGSGSSRRGSLLNRRCAQPAAYRHSGPVRSLILLSL